jgi:nickel transport protein
MSTKECSSAALIGFLFLWCFSESPAFAHKVYLFAWVEGDTIHTDSYYPDKRRISGGLIKVFDPSDGRLLLSGKTDDSGAFSFKTPKKTDLRIVLEAGMGHRTEFLLPASEFSQEETISHGPNESEGKEESPNTFHESQVDPHQLSQIIETALEKKLAPIERKLALLEKEEGAGFTEVIGGIGYIIGLMGLVLYFKSRKKA